jgi:dsRNA-specific ribonuclease
MDVLPPLPKIEGDVDLVLDVFTHASLKWQQDGTNLNEEYGDTDRLAEFGDKLLNLIVTDHFYSKRPMLSAPEIVEHVATRLSDENIRLWLDQYGLTAKYKYPPSEREAVESPVAKRRFFNTYVAALHLRSGLKVVQNWISHLIDPGEEPSSSIGSEPPESSLGSTSHMGSPPPPTTNPPPLPSGQPPLPAYTPPGHGQPGPAPPAQVTLALVNQTATQRGISCNYTAEQTGPPHLPTWTVRCYMNGVEQGRGSGKSQKLAREEAARQAWVGMGW